MNSVHVCMDLAPSQGGLHRYVMDFAECTGGSIVSVTTGRNRTAAGDPESVRMVRINGGWLGGIPCRASLTAPARRRLADALVGSDVVILHSLYRAHMADAARICLNRGIPYLVVVHGMLDPLAVARVRPLKQFWMRRVGQAVLAHAAAVVFATRAERDKAVYQPRGDQTAILLPAVKNHPDPNDDAGLRRRLRIASGERVLLYLNRFACIKRPLETLRAFGRADTPGVTLLMVGFDEDVTARRLRDEARRFPRASVRVLGPVDDQAKWPLLAAVDGFVSFSAKENFAYAFAEAMWAGLPCIVTTGHDLLGERLDGATAAEVGWVVRVDDADAFGDAVTAFAAAPPDRLVAIGAANCSWARSNLAEMSFASRAGELLARVASRSHAEALAS